MTDVTNSELLRSLKLLEERVARLERGASFNPPSSPAPAPASAPVRPTTPGKAHTSTELKIGQKWLSVVGIVLIFLAALFFVQFVFRFVGPAGKVGLSYVGAATLFGIAVFTRKKYQPFSAAVSAGAWGITFLVTYAMHFFPATRIIASTPLAMLLLMVVVGALFAVAFYQRSKILVALALLLGFLTVILSPISLFSIVGAILVLVVVAAIAVAMPWGDLIFLGSIGAYVSYFFWFSNLLGRLPAQGGGIIEKQFLALIALAIIWLITAITISLRRDEEASMDGHVDALTILGATVASAILGTVVINDLVLTLVAPRLARAIWLLLVAGLSGGWALIVYGYRPKKDAATASGIVAVVLVMTSVAYFLPERSSGTALAWAALGLIIAVTGIILRQTNLAVVSTVPLIASAVRFLASDLQKKAVPLTDDLSLNVVLGLLLTLVIAGAAGLLRTLDLNFLGDKRARRLPGLLLAAGLTVFYGMTAQELEGALPSVLWGLAGLATVSSGFFLRWKDARLLGLLALAATVARVLIRDLSDLEALPRVISFAILGGLLLLVGYGYNRNKEKLQKYLDEEP